MTLAIPTQLEKAFAQSGAKSTIPVDSQIGVDSGAASYTDGFPPLTRTPVAAGGIPPKGVDMNGILYELSLHIQWMNAGGLYPYNAIFAAAIGGYPEGATLLSADRSGTWANTVDGNTSDPDAGGAGWIKVRFGSVPSATYAEVAALTEDEGPIIVTDRGGLVWQWEDTAFFNGYRSPFSGKLEFGWTPTPLPWQVEAIGNTLNETDHGGVIARFRESGLTVALGSWVAGEYKIADMGGGEWKAPDMRDMFLRFTGTDADTANARTLGTAQDEAINTAGVRLRVASATWAASGAGVGSGQVYWAASINPTYSQSASFAGGLETRPINAAFSPVINL